MPQEPKTTGCAKVSSTVPRQNHAENITYAAVTGRVTSKLEVNCGKQMSRSEPISERNRDLSSSNRGRPTLRETIRELSAVEPEDSPVRNITVVYWLGGLGGSGAAAVHGNAGHENAGFCANCGPAHNRSCDRPYF
jgi:hypothetical protein